MIVSAILVLAQADWDGHMGGGWWWIVGGLGMVLFWGLIIVGVVWVVRELGGSRRHDRAEQDPVAVLDRRLAEGSISPEEYRDRRAILTGSPPPSATSDPERA